MKSLLFAAGAAMALVACSPAAEPPPVAPPAVEAPADDFAAEPAPLPTISALAAGTPELSTLAAAIAAAGLTETLNSEGPFTVFAPTNEAFAALPAGTLDQLLLPESRDALTDILGYHVVLGQVMAADVPDAEAGVATASVAGLDLSVRREADGSVMVNQYRVTGADIQASNGVVHIIDGVLIPAGGE
ncbi:fasciclin domain-containing protein [Hyphomonas sp.]|uniref:fasciclin domain-containing protein n=1 Tax=Hyphomonas sp. TaxID=87 RepID=UPI0039190D3E